MRLVGPLDLFRECMETLELTVVDAGHGGTSVVYKCRERRSGIVRACKIIDRRAVEKEHSGAMQQLQVRNERAVLCVFL